MGLTVLFVNDQSRITDGFKRAFRNEPFSAKTANSVEEAMAILEEEDIDVIVSDENMEAMPGLEFLMIVRLKSPDIIRIMLTGSGNLKAAERAVNNGEIFRFLSKPCNKVDLVATIRQALIQKNLIVENRELIRISRQQLDIIRRIERETEGIHELDKSQTGSIILSNPGSLSDLVKDLSNKLSLAEKRMNILP
jgi:DNA-binding NtrC family response regulator